MLLHPWDVMPAAQWPDFVRDQGFGHLVAAGRGRDVPVIAPTQFLLDGPPDAPVVLLHLARPNPLLAAVQENPAVVLSVAGDWAYVPAAWKATAGEDPALGVPTTYYAAVQLTGSAVLLDADATLQVLRAQLTALEPGSGVADPSVHRRLLPGIRGLRIEVDEVRAKAKYGGNVDEAHRRAAREHLRARGGPGDRAAASRVPGVDPG